MTYNDLDSIRDMNEKDAGLAEEFTDAIEQVLSEYSFKNMPRSVRFLGAGYGCMQIFCNDDVYTLVRNNGSDLDILFEIKGAKSAFISIIDLIYGNRNGYGFAEERFKELFGDR